MRPYLLCLLIAAATFMADQASKALVVLRLPAGESRPVIQGVFHLTPVANPGLAFGVFPEGAFFWSAVATLMLPVIIALGFKRAGSLRLMALGSGLASGGALGNLFDRLRIGKVIDFIDLHIWPVFNLADIAVMAGMVIMLIALLRGACSAGAGGDTG